MRLLTAAVLLISVFLSDWPPKTEANLASVKNRAKRATAKFYQDEATAATTVAEKTHLLPLDNHGLVLLPAVLSDFEEKKNRSRYKRSNEDRVSKYKRLSHSVHVQSDIRYR